MNIYHIWIYNNRYAVIVSCSRHRGPTRKTRNTKVVHIRTGHKGIVTRRNAGSRNTYHTIQIICKAILASYWLQGSTSNLSVFWLLSRIIGTRKKRKEKDFQDCARSTEPLILCFLPDMQQSSVHFTSFVPPFFSAVLLAKTIFPPNEAVESLWTKTAPVMTRKLTSL